MQKIKDHLGLIFISLVTILYLWLACNLVINFEDVKALGLNEKGDFLAGVFSPLGFLWLVYGYLQQGQELKQNTKALSMQATELRNSVEQQTKLVDTAKKELEITINKITKDNQLQIIQAQPFFHIYDLRVSAIYFSDSHGLGTQFVFILDFKNSRTICRSLYFTFNFEENSPEYLLDGSSFDIVQTNINEKIRVNVHTTYRVPDVTELPITLFFHFCYTDAYDEIQRQTIKIQLGKNADSNPYDHIYQWFSKSFTH